MCEKPGVATPQQIKNDRYQQYECAKSQVFATPQQIKIIGVGSMNM